MKTLKQACIPRPSTFDPTRRDTVLDLSDLIDGRIDPDEFFAVASLEIEHWREEAAAARILAGAVENDHV